MESGHWLRDKTQPPVLSAIENSRNSWVEVGNIFCETHIFAFLHSLGRECELAFLETGRSPVTSMNFSAVRRERRVQAIER